MPLGDFVSSKGQSAPRRVGVALRSAADASLARLASNSYDRCGTITPETIDSATARQTRARAGTRGGGGGDGGDGYKNNVRFRMDGMDLSHYFRGTPGKDRESMILPYRGCLVRSPRFRLNVGGGVSEFYDIPITSDRERYGEKKVTGPEFDEKRKELQALIDREMAKPPLYDGAIKSEFSPKLKDDKKSKNSEGKTD